MGWKCVPQVMGLVRGDGMRRDGKGQAKHRANAAAIIHEAFEIADQNDGHPIPFRKSASETYDRSRTPKNRYTGYRTADDVIAALEEQAATQTVEVQTKDKKTGETVIRKRPLRSDAVIGVAVILKPPCAIARTWTQDQYDKFYRDSWDVMEAIQCGGEIDKKTGKLKRGQEPCRLFRRNNIVASAEHWDEGSLVEGEDVYTGHGHFILKPEDEDGKYKGNLIDPYFLSRLSAVYPRMMRERGWDIEDCDCTDWGKFADEETSEGKSYRRKRKAKIRESGKSVNKYIADKKLEEAEAHLEEAASVVEQAAAIMEDVGRREQEAEEKVRIAEADRDKALAERDEVVSQKNQALKDKKQAEADANDAFMEQQQLELQNRLLDNIQVSSQEQLNALAEKRDALLSEVANAESDRDKARAEAETAKLEAEAAQADRDAAREEADALRRNAVARAKLAGREAAKATQAKIEADAREAWKGWLDSKKKQAEAAAAKIIEDAKVRTAEMIAAAAEAAQGEYAFLLKWLADPRQRYKTGESFLDVARDAHMREVRRRRMSAIPPEVRDAGRGRQTGAGRTGPGG